MAYETYKPETVLTATAQLMGFVNFLFCEYGMQLALEGELSDLKGLVDPEAFTGVEFELLDGLQDPVIKLLMQSVHAIDDTIRTLLMINSQGELEVMCDEEGSVLANEVNQRFGIPLFEFKNYGDAILDIAFLYQTSTFAIYVMALLCLNGGIDLGDKKFDRYCDVLPEETDLELLNKGNKNSILLYGLILMRWYEMDEIYELFHKCN